MQMSLVAVVFFAEDTASSNLPKFYMV